MNKKLFRKLYLLCIICCMAFLYKPVSAQTLPTAFDGCSSYGIQIYVPDNATSSNVNYLNIATGVSTLKQSSIAGGLMTNAIGYNPKDNRVWGISARHPSFGTPYNKNALIVIGKNSAVEVPLNTTVSGAVDLGTLNPLFSGDVNPNGILYMATGGIIIKVDLTQTPYVAYNAVTLISSNPAYQNYHIMGADFAFPRAGANLPNTAFTVNNNGDLWRFNVATGGTLLVAKDLLPDGLYGACFFDAADHFYVQNSLTGIIYKINDAYPLGTYIPPTAVEFVSSAIPGGNSDAARCANAPPITFDYGDAPKNYNTANTIFAARHQLNTLLPGQEIKLGYIGPDAENDGQESINADGDDQINAATGAIDDEDGVISLPLLKRTPGTYSVQVRATNTTNSPAFIYAAIDWNGSETWGSTLDQSTVMVPANTINGIFTVEWNNVKYTGNNNYTYARFRIASSIPNSDVGAAMTGAAPDGEVEDYKVDIAAYDFGDLPEFANGNSYKTKLDNGGAAHITNSLSAGQVLQMGTNSTDSEDDGRPGANADGDDQLNGRAGETDDEDAISSFTLIPRTAGNYSVTVNNIVNTTGRAAKLVGWIDFNADKIFQTTEMAIANVGAGTTPQITLTWSNIAFTPPAGYTDNFTYGRFRLTTDFTGTGSDILPTGALNDGEVEDYKIATQAAPPDLRPSISATPAIIKNTDILYVRIGVREITGNTTDPTKKITVTIPKSPHYTGINWDPAATEIGTDAIKNSRWTFLGLIGTDYIFELGGTDNETFIPGVIGQNGAPNGITYYFGFTLNAESGKATSKEGIVATIFAGSGGEKNNANNRDNDQIEYVYVP